MVYVRSRKFCCCLPVRFGVFSESILGIAVGGFFAVGGWIEIHAMLKGTLGLAQGEKIALWCLAISMTIFALTSLLGLIGAIGRIRSLVGLYAGMITFVTVLDVVAGIFFIYQLFHGEGNDQINKCTAAADNNTQGLPDSSNAADVTHWACSTGFAVGRAIVVVVYVLFWLIEIYGCVIAFEYVGQLAEERDAEYRDDHEKPAPQNITIIPQPAYAFSAAPNVQGARF
ncbi:hypothetical protein BD309DRAFT_993216 [Dichomitus squalens]|uniref:Uncharacterized protein n=1 Tax=Dichomitus squalens TaxID=114155 RepID=A0A4Q9MVV8_9APHY|nr:hypothetical protein BD311DRAFT_656586 [Dichomitus squalens]TBU40210.1 hypothetical protein BD309DRAFT_993216 [Dichomitus squalens]